MHYLVTFCLGGALSLGLSVWVHATLRNAVLRQARRSRGKPWLRFAGHRYWLAAPASTLLLASLGLSWLATGRLVFGLVSLLIIPSLLSRLVTAGAGRQSALLDRSSLGFLHALHGQIRTGASLPLALFRLSGDFETPFAAALWRFLQRYERGVPLQLCLRRFRSDTDLRLSATFLTLLELSYRNGLAVGPVLERVLPTLEADLNSEEKLRSLRISALTQALVAASIPWIMSGTLAWFQPGVSPGRGLETWLAVGLEAVGGFLIWKTSQFH